MVLFCNVANPVIANSFTVGVIIRSFFVVTFKVAIGLASFCKVVIVGTGDEPLYEEEQLPQKDAMTMNMKIVLIILVITNIKET